MAEPTTLRRRVYEVLEGGDRQTWLSRAIVAGLILLILVNVGSAIFETVPFIRPAHETLFVGVELVSLVVFGIEYVLRLWICVEDPRARGVSPLKARLRYAITPAAIVDLIAILPFFVLIFDDADVRTMVLVRLVRLLKLGRYSTGFQSLMAAVKQERHALIASLMVLASVVLISAALAYIAERQAQPDAFGTMPEAIWWAVVTVTTVGYGEVIPQTTAGRIIGGITMITGILMIALPVAIIGSSFAEVVRQRSFVVTFGLIIRMPVFSDLDAKTLHGLFPLLRAMTFEPGSAVIEPGLGDDKLYLVAEGLVEVDLPGNRLHLSFGELFGVDAQTTDGPVPATAVTRAKLLAIERSEIIQLNYRHPELADRLRPSYAAPDQGAHTGA